MRWVEWVPNEVLNTLVLAGKSCTSECDEKVGLRYRHEEEGHLHCHRQDLSRLYTC